MKTEIEHCKHFNPKNGERRDSCPAYSKCQFPEKVRRPSSKYDEYEGGTCGVINACLGYEKHICQYYED